MIPDSEAEVHGTISTITSSLLQNVKKAEDEGWVRLVEIYTPLVYLWCRRRGLQTHDARDIGQEVWRSVWRNISTFDRTTASQSFRGWLRTITENKIRDFWRIAPTQEIPIGHSDPNGHMHDDPDSADEETVLLFDRVVTWVSEKYKEHNAKAFLLVVAEGKNRDDVASELGITRNQVDLAVSRIRKALVSEFQATNGG